ncbi:MAG: transcriptional regulator FtsR [Nocardioidaceae bacterium]
MSIGEVLAALRADFPDVTISKIRYLETEGLVDPQRTPSGYRKFSPDDVERLRYVLTAQRDSFYPLKKIRENLEALDRGLEPDSEGGRPRVPRIVLADDAYPTAATLSRDTSDLRLLRAEVAEAAEIDDALLDQIEQYGLIRPHSSRGHYDESAVVIAKTVAELAAYGLEPRHLRAFKTAADREVGLFEQIVLPLLRQRDPGAKGRADDTVRHLAALSIRLHTSLVRNGLRSNG